MNELQVVLPPEYNRELRTQLTAIINEAVESVKKQAEINNNSPWLGSKKDAYRYLHKSPQEFDKLLKDGLPVHIIHGNNMFYKPEVDKFLLSK